MAGEVKLEDKKIEKIKEEVNKAIEYVKNNMDKINEVILDIDESTITLYIEGEEKVNKEIEINIENLDSDEEYELDDIIMDLDEELYGLAFDSTKEDLIRYLESKGIKVKGTDYDEDVVIVETEQCDDILYYVYYEMGGSGHYVFKINKEEVDKILEDC